MLLVLLQPGRADLEIVAGQHPLEMLVHTVRKFPVNLFVGLFMAELVPDGYLDHGRFLRYWYWVSAPAPVFYKADFSLFIVYPTGSCT